MAADATYQPASGNYLAQGGATLVVGGTLDVLAAGKITAAGVQAGPTASLVDSTGGNQSLTLAAIAAGAGYTQADAVAIKNALSGIALQVNALITLLKGIGASS